MIPKGKSEQSISKISMDQDGLCPCCMEDPLTSEGRPILSSGENCYPKLNIPTNRSFLNVSRPAATLVAGQPTSKSMNNLLFRKSIVLPGNRSLTDLSEQKGLLEDEERQAILDRLDRLSMMGSRQSLTNRAKDTEVEDAETQNAGMAWLMVFIVFMLNLIMDGYQYSCGVLFVEIIEEFNAENEAAAWISSIFQATYCVICPVAGLLMNMYGARLVVMIGSLLMATGILTSCYAPNIWTLYLTMGALSGAGCGMIFFVCSTVLCFWFEKKISFANGIARCGTGIGLFLFPPLLTYLIDEYGWRQSCFILAGLVLQCLVFASLIRHNNKIRVTLQEDEPADNALKFFVKKQVAIANRLTSAQTGFVPMMRKEEKSLKEQINDLAKSTFNLKLFRAAPFTLFVIANLIGMAMLKTPFLFIPSRGLSQGMHKSKVSWLVSVTGISNLLGRLTFGFVADVKFFRNKRLMLFALCYLVCGLATALSMGTAFYSHIIYVSVFGFFFGSVILLQPVVLKDLVGLDQLSAAFGMLRFGTAIPVLIGAPLIGMVYDSTRDYRVLFGVSGGVMCICSFILWIICIIKLIQHYRNST